MNSLKALLPYFKNYKARIAIGCICILISNFALVMVPELISRVIQEIKEGGLSRPAYQHFLWIVCAALVSAIFRFFIRQSLIVMSRLQEYELRCDLWEHIQCLPQEFFAKRATGDIMAHLSNDVDAVRMALGPVFMYSIDNICRFVFIIYLLLQKNVGLAVLVLLPLPLMSWLVQLIGKRVHTRFSKLQEAFSDLTTQAQQNFAGIRVIKSYVREDYEFEQFKIKSEDYMQKQLDLVKVEAIYRPLFYLIPGVSLIILIWYGGFLVTTNVINIGELSAFFICLGMLTWPMVALGWIINIAQRAAASMQRLNELFACAKEQDNENAVSVENLKGPIEFENISFAYGEDEPTVIKNISLKIKPGQTIAFVGRTGAGKSTLVNLIPRLYNLKTGSIKICGHDINDLTLKSLRKHVAVIPQEAFLFSKTIKENLRFGFPDASDEAIIHASEIAQLHKDIEEFPDKYETIVGERGITLSGGQKQRCSIARAILTNPDILILDDSFSAVDTATEEDIIQGLKK
ncbi:MAG: ABC transporter ATP-binding protein, partial [Lentisphaeria bacterium]|nr:ABC transporter ATP-binding protein/permease [Lentisphaeria bacterium]NQZ67894.1 ABC transporter ATP-binding protein [Lentisphaeria bacterium]